EVEATVPSIWCGFCATPPRAGPARRVASRYYQSWGSYGGRFAGGSHLRQSAALGAWSFACALLCKRVREIGGSLRESLEAIGGDMARGHHHDRRERCVSGLLRSELRSSACASH